MSSGFNDPQEGAFAGITPGPEGHLAVLHDKGGVGEVGDIADMVVVEMGEDDVVDRGTVNAKPAQPLGRGVKESASAPRRRLAGEAAVDDHRSLRRDRRPDEEIHGRRSVVRVGAIEPRTMRRQALRVLEGIQLVGGHDPSGFGSPSPPVRRLAGLGPPRRAQVRPAGAGLRPRSLDP